MPDHGVFVRRRRCCPGRGLSPRFAEPRTAATIASARQAKPTTACHDDGPFDMAISRHPIKRSIGDMPRSFAVTVFSSDGVVAKLGCRRRVQRAWAFSPVGTTLKTSSCGQCAGIAATGCPTATWKRCSLNVVHRWVAAVTVVLNGQRLVHFAHSGKGSKTILTKSAYCVWHAESLKAQLRFSKVGL